MHSTKRSFKRPFQPSISSYFGRNPADTETLPSTLPSPNLPATIQSSLLNVGMRVRKSVPEGYRTRPKTFCGSDIPSWGAPSHQTDVPNQHTFTGLVPYCGILKTGGYEPQTVPAEADLPPLQFTHKAWDLPFPSSQDSLSSNDSLDPAPTPLAVAGSTNHNKRRREDADEEDLDIEAQPVSPRSRPVSHTPMPNLDSVRAMAVPKTRRKVGCGAGVRESDMVDAEDFGEAEFLRPVQWGGGWMGFDRARAGDHM